MGIAAADLQGMDALPLAKGRLRIVVFHDIRAVSSRACSAKMLGTRGTLLSRANQLCVLSITKNISWCLFLKSNQNPRLRRSIT